ncbi:MAG: biotin--[acetyl-CoA-carboxylase] ligase [Cytophagales bacterium]|nr:biotin--[acetyl-CoA-carboxylase] ligase [Cytophagales bacterium]MDW8383496.1 biotin--[acetyl-CoA-carboxylase] ligase [Flammeovirgaceae bacterium]
MKINRFYPLISTQIVGKKLINVPECNSTNTLLNHLIQNTKLPNGTLLITENQTAGRGQHHNRWFSEPYQNLTFSFLWIPKNFAAHQAFQLNMATSLGLYNFLSALLPQKKIHIKWSNDILLEGSKICGILIENKIRNHKILYSVVGIGLNVNQTQFPIHSATSLKLATQQTYDLPTLLENICFHIEKQYQNLGNFSYLKSCYTRALYRYQELSWYENISHKSLPVGKFQGTILGINDHGKLAIALENKLYHFGIQEIKFFIENV